MLNHTGLVPDILQPVLIASVFLLEFGCHGVLTCLDLVYYYVCTRALSPIYICALAAQLCIVASSVVSYYDLISANLALP